MEPQKLIEIINQLEDVSNDNIRKARELLVLEFSRLLEGGAIPKNVKVETGESDYVDISKFPRNFNKLSSIRLVREIYKLSLKESKDLVEEYELYDPTGDTISLDDDLIYQIGFTVNNPHNFDE